MVEVTMLREDPPLFEVRGLFKEPFEWTPPHDVWVNVRTFSYVAEIPVTDVVRIALEDFLLTQRGVTGDA